MKFFMKCDDAAHVCDKTQYKEAGLFDKLMLKVHLLMCKLCRGYAKRNSKLTETIKSANIKTLRPEEKQRIKTRLQQEENKLH
jgi:predicted anti-sigma-YlaC factor YlaD